MRPWNHWKTLFFWRWPPEKPPSSRRQNKKVAMPSSHHKRHQARRDADNVSAAVLLSPGVAPHFRQSEIWIKHMRCKGRSLNWAWCKEMYAVTSRLIIGRHLEKVNPTANHRTGILRTIPSQVSLISSRQPSRAWPRKSGDRTETVHPHLRHNPQSDKLGRLPCGRPRIAYCIVNPDRLLQNENTDWFRDTWHSVYKEINHRESDMDLGNCHTWWVWKSMCKDKENNTQEGRNDQEKPETPCESQL